MTGKGSYIYQVGATDEPMSCCHLPMRSLYLLIHIRCVLSWCLYDALLVALHFLKMTAVRLLYLDVSFFTSQPTQWYSLELVALVRKYLPGYA